MDVEVRRVFCRRCQKMKQEKLDWLADSTFYTKRFSFYIGRRCRDLPSDKASERIIGYKTTIGRRMHRAMEQLGRLQRERKGDPPLPPINVKVNES